MFRRIVLFALFGIFLLSTNAHATGSEIVSLPLQDEALPYKILPDVTYNQYWIVNVEHGLIRLWESSPDNWNAEYFSIEGMSDAVGPDENDNLYLSIAGYDPSIKTFNTITRSVTRSVPLQLYATNLTFSQDQQHLYVCAWVWPALGESWSIIDGGSHRDSGRILDFDIATGTIVRTAIVGAMPETVYLTPYNSLLVSTEEDMIVLGDQGIHFADDPNSELVYDILGSEEYVDIVDINRFERIDRFTCDRSIHDFCNTFTPWSEDGRYVAMCNPELANIPSRPAFMSNIWIIDTLTNTISSTIQAGSGFGLISVTPSTLQPGLAYAAHGQWDSSNFSNIAIIQKYTGQLISMIDAGEVFQPQFIHELADDRIIVTGGESHKILIIDPT
jgi:hypothetical protein